MLPLLVASDDFVRLPAFLSVCGMPAPVVEAVRSARPETIQFLIEYGFAESTWNDRTGDWTDYEGGRDTPDVVVVGPDWLRAVEAKVYARQGRTVIADQLAAQRTLVEYWQPFPAGFVRRRSASTASPSALCRIVWRYRTVFGRDLLGVPARPRGVGAPPGPLFGC